MKKICLSAALVLWAGTALCQSTLMQGINQLQQEHGLHFVYDANLNLNLPYTGQALKGKSTKAALKTLFHGQPIEYIRRKNNVILLARSGSEADLTATAGQAADPARSAQLDEVLVMGRQTAPTPSVMQTGQRHLTARDLQSEASLLSSPDLIKTLQQTSGVAQGTELTSGLYVHGGGGDENLFVIDGMPLYHSGHMLGLFSSFNTDVIEKADFYKSGFPARYSGRLSSVTDVRVRDGNMKDYHGLFSLGYMDGRLQVEGPIKTDRTSFNIGMRYTWPSLFLPIGNASANADLEDYKTNVNLLYYDLNAKLTHRINQRNKLWFSLYNGLDHLAVSSLEWEPRNTEETFFEKWDESTKWQWGKLNGTLCLERIMNPDLLAKFALTASRSHSSISIIEKYSDVEDGVTTGWEPSYEKEFHSWLNDVGARADLHWTPAERHDIQLGGSLTWHGFRPQGWDRLVYQSTSATEVDSMRTQQSHRTSAGELMLYAQDNYRLTDRLQLDLGLSYTAMVVKNRFYNNLDPRLTLRYALKGDGMLSLSCTRMSQYIHKLSSSLLELPTDCWIPSTASIRPSSSWQWSAGYTTSLGQHWQLGLDAYYKQSRNLIRYRSWVGLIPSASSWEQDVTQGNGRSYGTELDLEYHTRRVVVHGDYTLAWNRRKFSEVYDHWFCDQFDNRHKVDLTARIQLSHRISMTAAWTWHSGNRVTLPDQFGLAPIIPGQTGAVHDGFIYSEPNNYVMPAYHRLDVGFDFHRITKRGRERIWNISLYNAYCHLNPLYMEVNRNSWGSNITAKCFHYIPIIPSFSYTVKFGKKKTNRP